MDHNDGWHPISLEDALGPASGRYFGAEYRHVHHELRDLRVAEELTAQGTVRYPSGWSMAEDGRERTPHLSTIDAVTLPLIALDAAGACSSNQYVSRIVLRAGSRPWFALDGVPVKMQLERPPMNASDYRKYAALVGNIKAELQFTSLSNRSWHSRPTNASTVYSELYKGTESRTVLTSFDQSAGTLTGRHWFSTPLSAASPEPHTLEAESWPAMSAIDYLVTMGQLVQVLIAEHTGSSRQSGNLWMRQMEIELPHPPSPLPCELVSHTKPLEQNVIERQDHRVHHVITESRTSNGVRVVAKLAQVEEK